MTSSPQAKRFNWNDLGMRVVSAVVLIPAAVAAIWMGGWLFLLMVSVAACLLALEWGQMSEPRTPRRIAVAVLLGVIAAVFAADLRQFSAAFVLLVFGSAAAALYARALKASAADAAYGVLYIGWPCVVLVWLRQQPDGVAWTVLLFCVAWAADIAAFAVGNLLKGPKLWPRFSPNKTWSGFVGGLCAGVAAGVAASEFAGAGLPVAAAAVVGLVGALATMAGDLWESALKRRFGVKDAGALIPGHGGLMDRVDGLMFAVVAIAACRLAIVFGGLS
ncbi:phosphatidate cytidylyltransferase [Caulobacter sp. 17J80-11]|uniref:phosphatidate cytidylyltransferase n=1 Tax=Caulobacter sp. 17J80-11 TaxID=2763502 RepID=UPI001653521B|nr:phosphatidate cytidylyltransferase [Caulobacter sp. 17J80-11]MBC6980760.1 phosphatidate cytidylyltransferase [Caulobacter sp. 17J80-11]